MSKMELFHGSDHVIERPDFHLGKTNNDYKDDIFVLDILREEMKNDDSRIQRILSE